MYGKVIFGNVVNSLKDVKDENIKGLFELMKWNNNKFKSNIDTIIKCFVKKGNHSINLFEEYSIKYCHGGKHEYRKKIKMMEGQEIEKIFEKNE